MREKKDTFCVLLLKSSSFQRIERCEIENWANGSSFFLLCVHSGTPLLSSFTCCFMITFKPLSSSTFQNVSLNIFCSNKHNHENDRGDSMHFLKERASAVTQPGSASAEPRAPNRVWSSGALEVWQQDGARRSTSTTRAGAEPPAPSRPCPCTHLHLPLSSSFLAWRWCTRGCRWGCLPGRHTHTQFHNHLFLD